MGNKRSSSGIGYYYLDYRFYANKIFEDRFNVELVHFDIENNVDIEHNVDVEVRIFNMEYHFNMRKRTQ